MKAFEIQVPDDPERMAFIADELAHRSGEARHRILARLRNDRRIVLHLPDDPVSLEGLRAAGIGVRALEGEDAPEHQGSPGRKIPAGEADAWAIVLGERGEQDEQDPREPSAASASALSSQERAVEPSLLADELWAESAEREPRRGGRERSDSGASVASPSAARAGSAAGENELDEAIRRLGPKEGPTRPERGGAPERRPRRPSPLLALLLGVLAPGLGQVYVGSVTGGLVILVCSLAIIPWPLGAVLAAREAARQRRGRSIADAPTRWGSVLAWFLIFWSAAFGFAWLASAPMPEVGRIAEPVLAPAPRGLEAVPQEEPDRPSEVSPAPLPEPEEAFAPEESERPEEEEVPLVLVEGLILEAEEACEVRDWARCQRLAERALGLAPDSRDALRLRLDAMVGAQEEEEHEPPP